MYLVTGSAGFIGYHVSRRLLDEGQHVVGLDNLNDYYEVSLKHARLERLTEHADFEFHQTDLADRDAMAELFGSQSFSTVIHLAAQAGVRYSVTHPYVYADSNLTGFLTILEGCRHGQIQHLVYASSSSVYGANREMPFSVQHRVDHPVSLYAATKKANELMAHTYSHLYGLPTTGLRFFTVYGPWGRPDMALFKFTRAILEGEPIDVYNHGQMRRDFTYIDDIVEGILRTAAHPPSPSETAPAEPASGAASGSAAASDPSRSAAPYRVYNIGNNQPVELLRLIEVLERCLGREADKRFLPMQPGDVPATFADIDDLARDVGFAPHTPIETGVARFVDWYRDYYHVSAD